MAHQTGFILLSNLVSKLKTDNARDVSSEDRKCDKIVIDNIKKTAEIYSSLYDVGHTSIEENHSLLPVNETEETSVNNEVHTEVIEKSFEVEQCSSENISGPITHIEIIKPFVLPVRRVTGANRVVPLLTNVWERSKPETMESSLSLTYRTYLEDIPNLDDRQCEICGQQLLSFTAVEYHSREVHNLQNIIPEQCFICKKKYIFTSQLRYHLSVLHGIQYPELICKICFMEFNTTIEQKAHERKHENTHACSFCPAKFPSEYFFQNHFNTHLIQVKPNECKKCGKRFQNSLILPLHEQRHENISCFTCVIQFQDELQLLLHMQDHTSEEKELFLKRLEVLDKEESHLEGILDIYVKMQSYRQSQEDQEKYDIAGPVQDCLEDILCAVSHTSGKQNPQIDNKKGIECKLCGIHTTSAKELLDHRQKFHLRNRTCPFCGKRNRSVSQTWRHMSTHISNKKNEILTLSNEEGSIGDENKERHMKENVQSYKCNICSRKFQYPGSRDKHMLLHTKDNTKKWKCTVCNKVFLHPNLLFCHMAEHEPEIKCHVCSKVFSKHVLLKNHLRTHFSDEKKKRFKCNLCTVSCRTPSGLRVHNRTHTGERPFACGFCHKMFRRQQTVKKHIRAVHGQPAFEYHNCCKCAMKFKSPGNLVRHFLRIHCQLRRYVCGICGARYGQNQDLRRHFKTKHQMEMPVISGSDRKSLNEVYVIPNIDNLPDSHPHAIKINEIVAEEKQKFKGVAELLNKSKSKVTVESLCAEQTAVSSLNFQKGYLEPGIASVGEKDTDPVALACVLPLLQNSDSSVLNHSYVQNEAPHLPNESGSRDSAVCSKVSEMKLHSCHICCKVFLGENDLILHLSERKELLCKICCKNFCDEVSLQEHLNTQHATFKSNVHMTEYADKNIFLKHMRALNGSDVSAKLCGISQNEPTCSKSLHVVINEVPSEKETNKGNTSSQNNVSVIAETLSNIVEIDSVLCTGISKQPLSDNGVSTVVNTLIPAPVNFDGVCSGADLLVRNIIIQPTGSIVQPVPYTFASDTTLTTAPVIAFQSTPLPSLVHDEQQTSLLMPINDLRTMAVVNGLDSTQVSIPPPIDQSQGVLIPHFPLDYIFSDNTLMSVSVNSAEKQQDKVIAQTNSSDKKQTEDGNSSKKSGNSEVSKNFVCTTCGELFVTSDSLSQHLHKHAEAKPFCCSHCGKSFAKKHNLKLHLRIHTGERPYTCEECGKQLRYLKDVQDHKRMHMGIKSFGCEECGRKFTRQRELVRHKVTHTGEKRHKCPICDKAFARIDQLKFSHMPIHATVTSELHKCEMCSKSFKHKLKLKQHEILHSGKKHHKCPSCNKSFALESYLKAHLRIHKKQDGYIKCPKCPRRFMSKETLQVHDTAFHKRHSKLSAKINLGKGKNKNNNSTDLVSSSEVESAFEMLDIQIQDVDLDVLEEDQCNTVIYLSVEGTEDLKMSLNEVSNVEK